MRRQKQLSFLLIAAFCFNAPSAKAGIFVGPGGTGASFLNVPMAARAAAMGGSFTAVSGDAASIEYNPAGLFQINRTDINATYISYLENTSLQALSAGLPVRPDTAAPNASGVQKNRFGLGAHYRLFHTNDTGRNDIGAKTGDFDVRDQMAGLALSMSPADRLTLGVGAKYIDEKIESKGVATYAADGGLLYDMNPNWTFGFSLLNLGPAKAFISEADPMPTTARVGVAYRTPQILLALDSAAGRDKIFRQSAGLEYSVNRNFCIRGGIANNTTLEFSGGIGVQFSGPAKNFGSAQPFHQPPPPTTLDVRRAKEAHDSTAIAERMTELVKRLTDQYRALGLAGDHPALAVFPLKSETDQPGGMFSDLLDAQLAETKEFTLVDPAAVARALDEQKIPVSSLDAETAARVGKSLGAPVVLLGDVVKIEGDKHMVNTRLIETDGGKTLATAYADVAWSAAGDNSPGAPPPPAAPTRSDGRGAALFPNIDIDLDYAFRMQGDFGFSHTISLKLLY